MHTEIVCIVSWIVEAAGDIGKVRFEVTTNPPEASAPKIQANQSNRPSLKETFNLLRVQRGTFETLRSASECEQILVEHTKHRSLIGRLRYLRHVTRKEPIYEGFATDRSFYLRTSKRWVMGTAPALRGTIHEGDDGTTIEVNLRVPIAEAIIPLAMVPMMVSVSLLVGDVWFLLYGVPLALLSTLITTSFTWPHRNAWHEYARFLETFLNAKQVSYESRPF